MSEKKEYRRTSIAACHYAHHKPAEDLEEVIGQRNEAESIAIWDRAFLRPSWSQITEDYVRAKVGQLCELKRAERQ